MVPMKHATIRQGRDIRDIPIGMLSPLSRFHPVYGETKRRQMSQLSQMSLDLCFAWEAETFVAGFMATFIPTWLIWCDKCPATRARSSKPPAARKDRLRIPLAPRC